MVYVRLSWSVFCRISPRSSARVAVSTAATWLPDSCYQETCQWRKLCCISVLRVNKVQKANESSLAQLLDELTVYVSQSEVLVYIRNYFFPSSSKCQSYDKMDETIKVTSYSHARVFSLMMHRYFRPLNWIYRRAMMLRLFVVKPLFQVEEDYIRTGSVALRNYIEDKGVYST